MVRNVLVHGRGLVDVGVRGGVIGMIEPVARTPGRRLTGHSVVDGDGALMVPGLHDHHIHLLATAAAAASVDVGPDAVADAAALGAMLRGTPRPDGWVRAIGYHETTAGDLDRDALDLLAGDRPVRVQHRSGARWTLNSAAIAALDLDDAEHHGLERDGDRLTGRIHRGDDWLRARLGGEVPDLGRLGRALIDWGVTGVTDTTPYRTRADLAALARAAGDGRLPVRVTVTGDHHLARAEMPQPLRRGPVKVVIDDVDLPALDAVVEQFGIAHGAGRPVAVHIVTLPALLLALAAWDDAGAWPGDRIEHGAVIPPDQFPRLAHHGLTVVTQPAFVAERGDRYLTDVDPRDVDHLYPCAALVTAGVRLAAGSDAPYAAANPWEAIHAAIERRTRRGALVGAGERLDAQRALALFHGTAEDPGGPARRVAPGEPADLCLIEPEWAGRANPVYGVVLAGQWYPGSNRR